MDNSYNNEVIELIKSICPSNTSTSELIAIISALSALASALFAGASTYFSRQSNNATKMQSHRESFDKIYGNEFEAEFKKFKTDFSLISAALISPKANKAKTDQLVIDTKALSIDPVRRVCNLMASQNDDQLSKIVDEIEAKFEQMSGILALRSTDWHKKSNQMIEDIQKKLVSLNSVVVQKRYNYVP